METGAIDAGERAYAAELLGENNRGTGYGVLSTVNGIGDFASSVTAGLLWTVISPETSFAYGATFSTIAAIMLIETNVQRNQMPVTIQKHGRKAKQFQNETDNMLKSTSRSNEFSG